MSETRGADHRQARPCQCPQPTGTALGPLCQQVLFYLLVYGEEGGGGVVETKAMAGGNEGT